jgi:hypothetical protein
MEYCEIREVTMQGDSHEDIEQFIQSDMTRGEKEQLERDKKAEKLNSLGLRVVSMPNARSEGQKRRHENARRNRNLAKMNEKSVEKLAKAWGCKYQLSEEK